MYVPTYFGGNSTFQCSRPMSCQNVRECKNNNNWMTPLFWSSPSVFQSFTPVRVEEMFSSGRHCSQGQHWTRHGDIAGWSWIMRGIGLPRLAPGRTPCYCCGSLSVPLRCSPSVDIPGLETFDSLLRSALTRIANTDISDSQWLHASLPSTRRPRP